MRFKLDFGDTVVVKDTGEKLVITDFYGDNVIFEGGSRTFEEFIEVCGSFAEPCPQHLGNIGKAIDNNGIWVQFYLVVPSYHVHQHMKD